MPSSITLPHACVADVVKIRFHVDGGQRQRKKKKKLGVECVQEQTRFSTNKHNNLNVSVQPGYAVISV
jgi:hypothetical protein